MSPGRISRHMALAGFSCDFSQLIVWGIPLCPHLAEVLAWDGGALGAVLARRTWAPSLLLVRRLGEPRGTWVVSDLGGSSEVAESFASQGCRLGGELCPGPAPQTLREACLAFLRSCERKPWQGWGPSGARWGRPSFVRTFGGGRWSRVLSLLGGCPHRSPWPWGTRSLRAAGGQGPW